MGHYISGIVAKVESVREFASSAGLHAPVLLTDGLGFLPLSDDHLDLLFPVQGPFDEAMTYPVAYIETEYFGGQGAQGATVYDHGRITSRTYSLMTLPGRLLWHPAGLVRRGRHAPRARRQQLVTGKSLERVCPNCFTPPIP